MLYGTLGCYYADILLCGVAEAENAGEVFSIAGKGII